MRRFLLLAAAVTGARAQLTFLRQAADLPEVADLKSRLAQDAEDDEAAIQQWSEVWSLALAEGLALSLSFWQMFSTAWGVSFRRLAAVQAGLLELWYMLLLP